MLRTTLNGNSTAGTSSLTLTSGSGVTAGESYVVGPNASGQTEVITVHGISTVTVTTRQPLRYSYAATHVFASRKAVLSVLAASLTSSYANCRAVWTYTTDSLSNSETSLFHTSPYAPVCTVTESDILRRLPLARNTVDPYQPLSELITEIFDNEVMGKVSVIWTPNSIISGDVLRVATIDRVMAEICLANGRLEEYDRWIQAYNEDMETVISTAPVDSDNDSDTTNENIYSWNTFRLARG
jgi:hypothetical protein